MIFRIWAAVLPALAACFLFITFLIPEESMLIIILGGLFGFASPIVLQRWLKIPDRQLSAEQRRSALITVYCCAAGMLVLSGVGLWASLFTFLRWSDSPWLISHQQFLMSVTLGVALNVIVFARKTVRS